ncbi:hypothetical protein [Solirubrobacter pauli]|uniref:hypothetical protein n=1 Tax=Solirubrobacter pauli TaxID=166793 RepID=UPI0011C34AEE|nr:hypothetical protein [Solirubrobacter pauli]
MKLRVALVTLAVLVAGLVLLWPRDADVRAGEKALARAEQAIEVHSGVVTPAQLTDEPIDRLVVVHGSNTAEQVRDAVGFDWDRADDEAWHCCEALPIWVFVRGEEVVAYFRAPLELEDVRPATYRPDAKLVLGRTYVRS